MRLNEELQADNDNEALFAMGVLTRLREHTLGQFGLGPSTPQPILFRINWMLDRQYVLKDKDIRQGREEADIDEPSLEVECLLVIDPKEYEPAYLPADDEQLGFDDAQLNRLRELANRRDVQIMESDWNPDFLPGESSAID
jgi:hypothetical protein